MPDFGMTDNFNKAGTRQGKTLAVRTVVLTLKPRTYKQTGKR